jgi:hypothetical protein
MEYGMSLFENFTCWLVICKLMRIQIQLITLIRIQLADPDPTFQFEEESALIGTFLNSSVFRFFS